MVLPDVLYKVHGSLMFFAFVVLMPTAIIFAALRRRRWFRWHYILMSLAFLTIVASFFVIYSVAGRHFLDYDQLLGLHQRFGFALLLAVFVQAIYGLTMHIMYLRVSAPSVRNVTPRRQIIANWIGFIHRAFGIIILLGGMYNIILGLLQYGAEITLIYIAGAIELFVLFILIRIQDL